jgi:hypothetical protein
LIVYLDTSVVLARLFAEDRSPPDALWSQPLVASRLLEYDALHLSTLDFLRTQGLDVALASYDQRLSAAAAGLGFALADC